MKTCSSVSMDKELKDKKCFRSSFLLIFWGKKFRKEIMSLKGSETWICIWRLVSSKLLKSRLVCFISLSAVYNSSSCFYMAAACCLSISSIPACFICITVLVSLWKVSPCFYRSAVIFRECIHWSVFGVFIMEAESWDFGKINYRVHTNKWVRAEIFHGNIINKLSQ